ncbi:phosphate ABC transporter permease PstA [Thioalkalivibrio sp. XN279]|nr:phosphate ABC transporter permease PstA [Thioalkalivibrio sp. XN279]NHA15310.1 phosphate ABC transporter permease PstA [Thioalkalivibrio sp. XN279]
MEVVRASLPRRYRAEARFKAYGIIALVLALSFLGLLLTSIISNGYTAFQQTYMQLEFNLDAEVVDPDGDGSEASLRAGNYLAVVRNSLYDLFPEVTSRSERRALSSLVSTGAMYQLQNMVLADPSLVGQTIQMWVPADDDVDMYRKGRISADVPEGERRLSDKQLGWIDAMAARDRLELKFNTALFTNGDSRDPELAGILGALKGSFYMLLVTLILSFPIGIAAAVYLEEFAPKNRWTDLIEVNINNLAAVPSIVFGLLGLAVFLNYFGMPRSAPLVGGLVLSLMTLPTIIIASRAALKAVPPSIREAALGMGASKMQTTFHHVVPLAMPGMLTGTIIGMAQALGETAPLLMIGMVAFIVDVPQGFTDPSTALPVQIFLWADSPERAFVERTSAAIIVLLGFLLVMNLLAVFLRRKFERRW